MSLIGGIRAGPSRRLFAYFLPLDLVFKVLTFVPFVAGLRIAAAGERASVYAFLAILAGVGLAVWMAWAVRYLRPVDRWERQHPEDASSAAALARAAKAIAWAPLRLSATHTLYWVAPFVITAHLLHGPARLWIVSDPRSIVFVGFMVAGVALGAFVVDFTLSTWLFADTTARLSSAAAERGLRVDGPSISMRQRLMVAAFCITMAPTCWLSGLAYTTELTHVAGPVRPSFLLMLIVFQATLAAFGPLCAWLVASTLAGPLVKMDEVISTIADRGDFASVGRVPIPQHDEIGLLAGHVNGMIEKLEGVWRERAHFAESLSTMNRELEAKVRDRTHLLEQRNEQLRREISDRERVETELRLAQKLESVGQLAAGVAHEINTPVQFVSDSIHFVRDATESFRTLLGQYQDLHRSLAAGAPLHQIVSAASAAAEEADLDYLLEHVPKALDRSLDGLGRVATIVRSMKEFAHPDSKEMVPLDVNHAIETTLILTRNEYKYVADVETDFGELPPVRCHPGDVNQAILNLLVNSAHAITDVVKASGGRGRITVRTRHEGDRVLIAISDTGGGIDERIRSRIFDPFFTTKEVGRGTGQGLALARAAITARHGGELTFETTTGAGTTFFVRLPVGSATTAASGNAVNA